MSQKSSVPQAVSFVSQALKRDSRNLPNYDQFVGGFGLSLAFCSGRSVIFGFDVSVTPALNHASSRLAKYRQDVFDLLRLGVIRRQQRNLVVSNITALGGPADQLL